VRAPFFNYSRYLKQKYGEKAYRIAVDAGFGCPHRDEGRRAGGCVFCDASGSRAPYLADITDMKRQIESASAFIRRRYGAQIFLLYFQAFTNTNAPVKTLKRIYDSGLAVLDFHELIVSTRPDCIDKAKIDLLAGYLDQGIDVWVELGLQSASNKTLRRISRGHSRDDFTKAVMMLKSSGIKVAAHVIFGLPGEAESNILDTIQYTARLGIDGIKIHDLHIPKNAALYSHYLSGELSLPCRERHLEYCIKALELLPPSTVIMRLTCDTRNEALGFPRRQINKADFYHVLRREMIERETFQGKYFSR
jgi:hypothetical protein